MTEPTPGPYEARGDRIVPVAHRDRPIGGGSPGQNLDHYAKIVAMTAPCRETTDEDRANARLLAASWEMREALKEIADYPMPQDHPIRGIAARALAKVRNES